MKYVHVADIRTSVLHSASTTHGQLTAEQLIDVGISDNPLRISESLEHIGDIIEDIKQPL